MKEAEKTKPPTLANWLVFRFIKDGLHEEFLGDLEEIYEDRILTRGKFYANLLYWIDALHLLFGFTSFKLFKTQNRSIMLQSYLKVAVRNFSRNKVYSLINILGLAVGMGVCPLIFQYVYFELSYDKFHDNFQNTYRITLDQTQYGVNHTYASTTFALGPSGKETIPEIKQYVRVHPQSYATVTNPEKNEPFKARDHDMIYVDPTFFQAFNFPLKRGSRESVFADKFNIVITEKAVRKYFGSDDPMGKTLKITGDLSPGDYIVSGVLKDPPINSHLQFEFLLPLENLLEFAVFGQLYKNSDGWDRNNFMTYAILDETADLDLVSDKLDQLIVKHRGERNARADIVEKVGLQPIADIHLKSESHSSVGFVTNYGNIENIQIFSIIAFFILIIAWVNYINLSTARSMHRAKEVGIRKTTGAFKGQLISQFMTESLLINFLSAVLAIGIAFLLLPVLSRIIEKELELGLLQIPMFWVCFLIVILFGSLLSGLYPAFVLSAFKPISMLGSKKTARAGKVNLRRGLIVFQFLTSLLLISSTYLVYKQITFMKNQELGIDMEKILVLSGPEKGLNSTTLQAFRTEVTRHHSIAAVATSGTIPGEPMGGSVIRKLGDPVSANQHSNFVSVGFNFPETYDFEFLAGGPFTPDMAPDLSKPARERKNVVIINEEAVRAFGFGSPENAIQETFIRGDNPSANNYREYRIIGVVKNVHWSSLRDAHTPYLIKFSPHLGDYISFKISLSNIQESIAHIKKTYNAFYPGNSFEYYFLEDAFNRQYQAEVQFGNLFLAFTLLAIFIACIGLFALVSFSATMRIKEIGIRKVHGANISNIMVLLSREYVILLLAATALAIPAIVYWGSSWLENYAFRIDIGLDLFAIPLWILFFMVLLTVSYRTYSAAKSNPVDSLKTE